jgi:hypothetical protein
VCERPETLRLQAPRRAVARDRSEPNTYRLATAAQAAESWVMRPQKITLGEMRSGGGRLVSWSIAPTTAAATRSRCRPIDGRMMCGCRILSRGLFAKLVASAALTCGRTSSRRGWDYGLAYSPHVWTLFADALQLGA